MKPELETLESRDLLATAFVQTGVLWIMGTPQSDQMSVASDGMGNTTVDLDFNGTSDFVTPTAGLTRVMMVGGNGDDLLSSQPGQTVPTTILGGSGVDNATSFTTGSFDGGPGNDSYYNIVAAATVNGAGGRDRLVVSVAATIVPDVNDQTPVIFGQTLTKPIQLINRVVYFNAGGGNDSAFVRRSGTNLLVYFNGRVTSFRSQDVDVFASVLGAGNDTFILADDVTQRMVAYGAGGSDFLKAGRGDALLKGGGDSDIVLGGTGADDLTGSNGEVSAAADYVDGGAGKNLLRVDATDWIFASAVDIVVGFNPKRQV